jgi:hypothetical protein
LMRVRGLELVWVKADVRETKATAEE